MCGKIHLFLWKGVHWLHLSSSPSDPAETESWRKPKRLAPTGRLHFAVSIYITIKHTNAENSVVYTHTCTHTHHTAPPPQSWCCEEQKQKTPLFPEKHQQTPRLVKYKASSRTCHFRPLEWHCWSSANRAIPKAQPSAPQPWASSLSCTEGCLHSPPYTYSCNLLTKQKDISLHHQHVGPGRGQWDAEQFTQRVCTQPAQACHVWPISDLRGEWSSFKDTLSS